MSSLSGDRLLPGPVDATSAIRFSPCPELVLEEMLNDVPSEDRRTASVPWPSSSQDLDSDATFTPVTGMKCRKDQQSAGAQCDCLIQIPRQELMVLPQKLKVLGSFTQIDVLTQSFHTKFNLSHEQAWTAEYLSRTLLYTLGTTKMGRFGIPEQV